MSLVFYQLRVLEVKDTYIFIFAMVSFCFVCSYRHAAMKTGAAQNVTLVIRILSLMG